MKNLVYIAVLSHNNEPLFTQSVYGDSNELELEMIVFSSLDQFDVYRANGQTYGGFLGSHCIKDDVYFAYGNTFGTRIKVVVITQNYQAKQKEEIRQITTQIHQIYVDDQLNPFCQNENYSDAFVSKILNLC